MGGVSVEQFSTEAEKGHSILPFYHSAVLPFCRSAFLPFCRSAILAIRSAILR